MQRRHFLASLSSAALAYLAGCGRVAHQGSAMTDDANSKSLRPLAFQPLPLGSIRPAGWLHNQLRIQADGLTGHLDEFWPDIKDSAWIGGSAEGWERGPYWLDGTIPLAYALQDEKLIAKVRHWVDYILNHQQPNGWLAPTQPDKAKMYDPWPTFVVFKALIQWYEVTHDSRIIPALSKCMARMSSLLDEKPLASWGRSRWGDLVWSVHWLYGQTGEASLLDFAAKAHAQGEDWSALFTQFPYRQRITDNFDQTTHGVNNGMAIKAPGVWFRQSGDERDKNAVTAALHGLDTYHGQPNGMFSCDEHLAGRSPSQGTELCTVVEEMFSLEVLTSILGEAQFADRLERITFNALPATFKSDMCAHQYDQQVNQVVCKISPERVFATNGEDANLFGLEPNFGCCTANMHQGWPKFTSHLWMQSADHGLAAIAYAPCQVRTQLQGHSVQVEVATDYPFGETIKLTVTASAKLRFPLYLRIPAWAEGAQLQIDGAKAIVPVPGTFHHLEREWHGSTLVTLHLPMQSRVARGYRNSIIIERGPLVYALKVGEDWQHLRGELPFADWEVHPTTPWDYALEVDVQNPAKSLRIQTQSVGPTPFSTAGAPVHAKVMGRRLPSWTLEQNAAAPPPSSPTRSDEPLEELTLIPYGCAKLRVTEFPLLA